MTLAPFQGKCWTCGTEHPDFSKPITDMKIEGCTFTQFLPYDFLSAFYEKWKDKVGILEDIQRKIESSKVEVNS